MRTLNDICIIFKKSSFSLEATSSKTIKYTWKNKDNEWIQSLVNYAYEISGWDLDFLETITHESMRDHTIQSNYITSDWKREESYGLGQRNIVRYSDIIEDPRFKDPYWQLDIMREKYKVLDDPWTIFHWYYSRKKHSNEFDLI